MYAGRQVGNQERTLLPQAWHKRGTSVSVAWSNAGNRHANHYHRWNWQLAFSLEREKMRCLCERDSPSLCRRNMGFGFPFIRSLPKEKPPKKAKHTWISLAHYPSPLYNEVHSTQMKPVHFCVVCTNGIKKKKWRMQVKGGGWTGRNSNTHVVYHWRVGCRWCYYVYSAAPHSNHHGNHKCK